MWISPVGAPCNFPLSGYLWQLSEVTIAWTDTSLGGATHATSFRKTLAAHLDLKAWSTIPQCGQPIFPHAELAHRLRLP